MPFNRGTKQKTAETTDAGTCQILIVRNPYIWMETRERERERERERGPNPQPEPIEPCLSIHDEICQLVRFWYLSYMFMPYEISHPYQLDQSISVLRVAGLYLSILFIF